MNNARPQLALLKDDLLNFSFYDVINLENGKFHFYETDIELPDDLRVVKFCDLEEAGKHLEDEEYDGRFKWDVVSI